MSEVPTPDTVRTAVGVRDVARLAGVSTQTVSRVINDHPHIRDETRERVRQAMATLGYRVNNAARALGTRTTRTLGVIVSDAALYGPAAGVAALDAAARGAGRWIATAYADAADPASVTGAAERLLAQGVDGLILLAPHRGGLAALDAAGVGVPVAALHTGAGADRQAGGARLAAEHLLSLGHRRIAVLSGPDDWLEASARDAGTDRALTAAAVAPAARWHGDWSAESGAARASDLAPRVRRGEVTAVAVANDQMALGLIAGLRAEGARVPDDVSVTGFDDNPDAAFYLPGLTTVRLDLAGEAERVVGAVLAAEDAGTPAPAELIVRASTATPRAG